MSNAFEEGLTIYEGDTSGSIAYYEAINYLSSNTVTTISQCLTPGAYTAVMGDTYGNGWTPGSMMQILLNGVEIAVISWTCATTSTYSCTTTFSTSDLPEWQYSSTPQTTSDWTTGTIDWPSASSDFPAPTTTTRYFRRSIPLEGEDKIGILVSLQMDAGAVVYVNGLELTRWNMPEGEVTSSTQATTSGEVVTHYFNQILGALPSPINDAYVIAVEVHAAATIPSTESFSGSANLFSADLRLVDSDGSYFSDPEGDNASGAERGEKLYDNNVNTKWCAAIALNEFPAINIWTFGNGDRRVMNKYALSTANDAAPRDCVAWTIEGSNDGSSWDTLDTRSGITWSARLQTQYFEFSNSVAYNKYRWSCSEVADYSAVYYGGFIQMSEWRIVC